MFKKIGNFCICFGWCSFSQGKGNKERMLPMGEVAIDYLGIYEENSRPFLLKSEQTDAYFLSNRGAGMSRQNFFYAVKS
jgi:integrase/recombinase XerD